jgi:hypothetical protein
VRSISDYNATEPPARPPNMSQFVAKRLMLRGFLVPTRAPTQVFEQEVGRWLREGKLVARETTVDGIERAPQASSTCCEAGTPGRCSCGWPGAGSPRCRPRPLDPDPAKRPISSAALVAARGAEQCAGRPQRDRLGLGSAHADRVRGGRR